jgi:hypothetical protein
VTAAKEYYYSILVKEIQQQNNDVPDNTEVASAVVFPIIKRLPDDGPMCGRNMSKIERPM